MPTLAGLTTYGISYAGIWAAIAADIMPEDLKLPLVLLWSTAGLVFALVGVLRGKS